MPLLSPQQILRELRPEPIRKEATESLASLLEKNNLTPDEILDQLSSQMRSSDQASVRLQAAKIGLQLNGLLDSEERKQDFNVTIIINDSEFGSLNPILIPRPPATSQERP